MTGPKRRTMDAVSLETSMLVGNLGLILLLQLTLALGSIRAAQQTGGSAAPDPRQQATARTPLVLEIGTRVQLMLAEKLDTAKRGGSIEGVKFQVFPEVRVGDLVLIERGAYAWGRVEMKRADSFGRNGSVRVTALRALAITGAEVPLRGNANEEGSSLCFDAGCLLFGTAGGDAVMERGTKVEAYIARDVPFDPAKVKEAMAEAEHKKAAERSVHRNQAKVFIYRMSYDVDRPDAWHILAAMRDAQEHGAGLQTSVSVDGHEVVRLGEYRCIVLTLTPGKHLIASDKSAMELDLIGGEDYYLRISEGSKNQLRLVSTGEGEEQIYPMLSEELSEP